MIKIHIAGKTASGKSTVAQVISEALYKAGFAHVEVVDNDGATTLSHISNLENKVQAIQDTTVIIETRQIHRNVEMANPCKDINIEGLSSSATQHVCGAYDFVYAAETFGATCPACEAAKSK